MKITILKSMTIDNIPSGSGMVKSGDLHYIIGDDSPFLFTLNNDFKTIAKTQLLDSVNFSNERIIKSKKPDFEAMEIIEKNEIVIFGSGSIVPERAVFIRILLKDSMIIERYDISDFYKNLKNLPVFHDSELNIEATAYYNNQIFLFNRKKNLIIKFRYTDLLRYIQGEKSFPQPEIKQFSLPKMNGIKAGFSGATALVQTAKIIFTASVENTDNAYDDGEILGSYIGMLDISNNTITDVLGYCDIPVIETPLKIESVTVKEEISVGKTKVVLVADDDKGNSILLEGILFW